MNYLAHLHIAQYTNTSLTGNLLGDFVKGSDLSHMPIDWQRGIKLHRYVDSYTDSHELVIDLKRNLGEYRRFAGIILDILFDHLLAKRFSHFTAMALTDFTSECYKALNEELVTNFDLTPVRYRNIVTKMIEMQWLQNYQDIANIETALYRTGQRLKTPVELQKALTAFHSHEQLFTDTFNDFYKELLVYAQIKQQELTALT